MENKITVGQTLYMRSGKFDQNPPYKEEVVDSVGAKYIYLKGYLGRYPIEKATLSYKDKIKLYLYSQDIVDQIEGSRLLSAIRTELWKRSSTINLDKLQESAKILDIKNEKPGE